MTAELKHADGMSYGAITKFLKGMSGLTVERSTLARGDERLADKLMPTYNQLILRLREKQVVYGDETGWRVGGKPAWLWAFDSEDITVYEIDPTRKHEVIERILTAKFKGVLKSDCFVAYDDEDLAGIQKSKCLGHLIRRSRDIELVKSGRAVQFSKRVTQLLRAAIRLKACMSQMTQHGYAVARGRLEAALDRLLAGNYSDKDNARLARLLLKQRHALFNFLDIPGCDATNNAAERAIRPAVIIRKTNGCNRTDRGKSTHKVIASVLRTCAKQGRNFGSRCIIAGPANGCAQHCDAARQSCSRVAIYAVNRYRLCCRQFWRAPPGRRHLEQLVQPRAHQSARLWPALRWTRVRQQVLPACMPPRRFLPRRGQPA